MCACACVCLHCILMTHSEQPDAATHYKNLWQTSFMDQRPTFEAKICPSVTLQYMESKGSLPCSQEPNTWAILIQSMPLTLSFEDAFWYCPSVYAVFQMAPFPHQNRGSPLYMPCPSYSFWFGHPSNMLLGLQMIMLLTR